ncbi:ABC transporter A family protein [Cavenderia fasciculata]|uniref:ABC transporter A family protein n=1 Tax=Cavenderia fasciculata TaxID=261658 RepID=F4PJE5_CACFS|nr:ABC transporter A family protein [Cavenderia fasciculata]EGG24431.1 ABC transporter A family protein [Cavenderia fasciculata]|eukprot:XP_004362282.1 ABC transporter A family protein [Cavenderia fasciculata]
MYSIRGSSVRCASVRPIFQRDVHWASHPTIKSVAWNDGGNQTPSSSTSPTTLHRDSTFKEQLIALLGKNILIKKRNRTETIGEILIGIYYVAVLIIIKMSIPVPSYEPTEYSSLPMMYPINSSASSLPFAYVPDSTGIATNMLKQYLEPISGINLMAFESETSMVNTYFDNPQHYWGGVVFNQIDLATDTLDYSIRLNTSYTDNYQISPYVSIQSIVLSAYVQLGSGLESLEIFTQTQEYPSLPRAITSTITYILPIYFPLFFMYSLQQLIVLLVTEKKDGIKEGLKVMGMKESAYWLSYISIQLVMNTTLIVLALILCFVTSLFHYTSPILIFLQFFLYSLTVIGIAFFVSAFINAPKVASTIASLIVLVGIGLSAFYQFYLKNHVPSIKYLLFLFSPCAFGDFLTNVSFLESEKTSISWNSEHVTVTFGFMILDFIIYSLMAWYAIEVFPGEYGAGRSWFFFLDRHYWSQSNVARTQRHTSLNGTDRDRLLDPQSHPSGSGIEIFNLIKEYNHKTEKGKKVRAVDGVTYSIQADSVFSLLGHNGAGKSTTMGILTGMIPITSGSVFINGLDVSTQMDHIRRHIGFCPQTNMLYNQLTCAEHLRLFGKIKGVEQNQLEQTIIQSLEEVQLLDKKDSMSSSLSGGMKRRLSIAMAFIGNPSIVFLDECTTGLDVFARHQIWNLLQLKKPGKTIVLTTHFMEEAELLGDCIGIMSHGKLRCKGTAMELKTLFELGYKFTVTIKNTNGVHSHEPFEKFFSQHFKNSKHGVENQNNIQKSNESSSIELTYSLSHQKSEDLTNFFEEFESIQHKLGVERIGVSNATLEEAFLKIQNEDGHSDE